MNINRLKPFVEYERSPLPEQIDDPPVRSPTPIVENPPVINSRIRQASESSDSSDEIITGDNPTDQYYTDISDSTYVKRNLPEVDIDRLQAGDVVMAKFKKFKFWPARVAEENEFTEESDRPQRKIKNPFKLTPIYFFGFKTYENVVKQSITNFSFAN